MERFHLKRQIHKNCNGVSFLYRIWFTPHFAKPRATHVLFPEQIVENSSCLRYHLTSGEEQRLQNNELADIIHELTIRFYMHTHTHTHTHAYITCKATMNMCLIFMKVFRSFKNSKLVQCRMYKRLLFLKYTEKNCIPLKAITRSH